MFYSFYQPTLPFECSILSIYQLTHTPDGRLQMSSNAMLSSFCLARGEKLQQAIRNETGEGGCRMHISSTIIPAICANRRFVVSASCASAPAIMLSLSYHVSASRYITSRQCHIFISHLEVTSQKKSKVMSCYITSRQCHIKSHLQVTSQKK